MKDREEIPSPRRLELLAKLEERARECPGLYPIQEAEDFLRVAVDHAGEGDEGICEVLEAVWRRPDEAVQLNAQSLIRRGNGLGSPRVEQPSGVEAQRVRKRAD
ncbi:MAG: hypothetical protein NTZ01_04090 [Verrucomicrobia bacterium]|nr:hypothetical protein [Verrucomicrobiota bacterium]